MASPSSPLRTTVSVEAAGDTSVQTVVERFGFSNAAGGSSLSAAGGGATTSSSGLPSIDGLEICCIGAGYVGGPTMAVIAKYCPTVKVTVVDMWKERIDAWNSDDLPIYEPGLDELIKATRGKNLFFSTDVEGTLRTASIIFVSVNTPTKSFGIGAGFASNVGNIEKCARTIAATCSDRPRIIVEKSTVPVKTAETLRKVIAANSPPGATAVHQILSNPEFLAEGSAVRDLTAPARVLIGGDSSPAGAAAVAQLAAVYAAWVPPARIITTNLWSSELSKLVANAFLAQRISSINSISALCEATGADVDEVGKAIGSDPRIGPGFLKASVGFGGSCFKKDLLNLVYLCRCYGLEEPAAYWHSVVAMNDWQMGRFARCMLDALFNSVQGKRIALLGFAFKKDTGDVRESAAAYVARTLLGERALLQVYDPKVRRGAMLEEMEATCGVSAANTPELESLLGTAQCAYSACAGAHAVAVLTEWDEFKALDWQRIYQGMSKPAFLFDGRGILDLKQLRAIGFQAYAIGKPLAAEA